jgi:hypothetical protein
MPIHGYPGNVITANPTAPTSTVATGVWTTEQQLIAKAAGNWPMALTQIGSSLRFNSADSAYMTRTPASSSNRRTWTWSGWFKRSTVVNVGQNLFSTDNGSSTTVGQLFFNDGILELNCYASSAYQWRLITTQVWRDLSAWYHIVAVVDTTQATSSNRVKLYVNGVQITAFTTATYPSQNFEGAYNLNQPHYIGASITSSGYLNGYLTEVNFIDGQALTPSSFGFNSSDTGVWSPKQYIGSYGTNGFYLPMSISETNPTWNYDPMNTFGTYNASGSMVQSSTQIYLSGATYDGGYKAAAVSPGSFTALQNNWSLDFQLNRDGVNSSPFPNYTIAIGRQSSATTYFSTSGAQDIVHLVVGNNYNYNWYVYNGNGTQLYTFGGSGSGTTYGQYAVAGSSGRVTFNFSTFTFTFFARVDGSFSGMTQIGTYTLSAGEKAAMLSAYQNTNFYITSVYRSNNDGWRNIDWYTTV